MPSKNLVLLIGEVSHVETSELTLKTQHGTAATFHRVHGTPPPGVQRGDTLYVEGTLRYQQGHATVYANTMQLSTGAPPRGEPPPASTSLPPGLFPDE